MNSPPQSLDLQIIKVCVSGGGDKWQESLFKSSGC